MNVKPLTDKVLIKPLEEEDKRGFIIIPDTAKKSTMRGEVIEVGPGGRNEAGDIIPIGIKKGDKVFYVEYSGVKINIEDQGYLIVQASNILAILS